MLSLRTLPRCVSHYVKQSQLHTSVKLLSTKDSSSSSSSDSSDSDSDKEQKIKKNVEKKSEQEVKSTTDEFLNSEKTNERLNALLLKITETSAKKAKEAQQSAESSANKSDNITSLNVALKSRQVRLKKSESQKVKKEPIEDQIVGAAKDVAKTLGGDTQKTELELLSQILNLESKESETKPTQEEDEATKKAAKKAVEEPVDLGSLLSGMKVESSPSQGNYEERRQKKAMQLKEHISSPSVTASLLRKKSYLYNNGKMAQPKSAEEGGDLNLKSQYIPLDIFKDIPKDEPQNVPRLSTWERMEQREMKLATLMTPQNVFQELILWTEQGKLWHFPINNEQGMEEEEKIHFSEHVFMERHLKGWCPKKGPIRHFMELVCTGLSKNPYMTVEEKIGHINWYQNYFESKKDLLYETGALERPIAQEKQIEA